METTTNHSKQLVHELQYITACNHAGSELNREIGYLLDQISQAEIDISAGQLISEITTHLLQYHLACSEANRQYQEA